jgi:formylglycine-generating enzyme required for sulfatase activity
MRKTLVCIALLCLDPDLTNAAGPIDKGAKKFTSGYEFLTQHKYQEARTALEAVLQEHPANAQAHFYLGDACRGLKAWACAESHYETSLELDAHSPVAGLAKQRGHKAKVWRLLDEGKQALAEPTTSAKTIALATNALDMANKLGLDDEQLVVYRQVYEQIQQGYSLRRAKTTSVPPHERSMAMVPAGKFMMGSTTGDADEQPVHPVYLDAFFMDIYQVSVGHYAEFLASTSLESPPDWNIMNQPQHWKRPVVNVNWTEAEAYCHWVGKRLPTEAEREKAARGTDGRIYPWGNEPPTRYHANMQKERWSNHAVLMPVGTLDGGKSPYGIHDMAGNVWEWVSDWYGPDYYKTSYAQNPTGPTTGMYKVIRGGSWGSGPKDLRSSDRNTHLPSFRGLGTGFRCAKSL